MSFLSVAWVILSYLIGSIPFGLIVTRILGTPDPRTSGSKNIGFTNVLRVCGKKAGYFTLAGDMGKGFIVVLLTKALGLPWNVVLGCAFMVTFGHIFSLYLKFKGGKGVATALGAILGVNFIIGLCLLGIWFTAVAIFKISSGGALSAFSLFPVQVYFFAYDQSLLIFSIVVGILIVYCHRENISRILEGTEGKTNKTS